MSLEEKLKYDALDESFPKLIYKLVLLEKFNEKLSSDEIKLIVEFCPEDLDIYKKLSDEDRSILFKTLSSDYKDLIYFSKKYGCGKCIYEEIYKFNFNGFEYYMTDDKDIRHICCSFMVGAGIDHSYSSVVIRRNQGCEESVSVSNSDSDNALAEFLRSY